MKEEDKDLNYWKENAKDAYMTTPICVLRYITELEKAVKNNAVLPLVSCSACDIIEIETTIQLLPRKWWQFHKIGWQKHTDFFGKRYFVRYRWSV